MIRKYTVIDKLCKCGCGRNFKQFNYQKGYIRGHSTVLQKGNKSPGWTGGIINKRGYIFIYTPEHPHNDRKYVKRSRLTMEKKLGRYLHTREHVHHINGIKDDDRIENLALLSISEHMSLHKKIPKGKWSWKHKKCSGCSTTQDKHYGHGFCRKCYSLRYYKNKSFS